jgi:putative tricarboxylic transport membrane protein
MSEKSMRWVLLMALSAVGCLVEIPEGAVCRSDDDCPLGQTCAGANRCRVGGVSAGGSAGGSDHILLGMIGKAAGVPASKLSYVAYAGGGPAQAALLGAHVAAGISGYGEFAEQIKAGKLRAIAISADKRQPGIDVPTLKEQGIDVELFNWRGLFAPPGTSNERRDELIKLVDTMAKSAKWTEEATKRDWTTILLTGDAYAKFLDDETTRIEGILKDLGLAS